MAFKNIKGLVIEIGGDTTKLDKALETVNKKSSALSEELGEINRMLKLDPGNTDLLNQKMKVLAEAISNTSEKLDKLKEAEKQVQEQFEKGEVSEAQYRALQREIMATERKLGSYENAARETVEEIEQLGKCSGKTADEVENLGKQSKASADELNAIANGGLKAVGGLVTAAAGALTAAAESTREYRNEMGKLDTAFTESGHTTEAATQTYKTLQSVLGESDQAVEAANHLAKLCDTEEQLATWTDIATGVYATFGASLPIEGLTEAANETAKTGALTGSLADALNWAGVNEDAFQEKLDACNTEQERQALITETLNGLYAESAEKYREVNAEVIAANAANEQWQASLAQVGAAVEPVLTRVKEIGAQLLSSLVPAVETLLNNLPTIAVVLAGITAALVSYKVAAIAATAAEKGMTVAQYAAAAAQKALNVAMSANPIGLIIVAITALVAAFTYLWTNCEDFREFWINLWEKIKEAASAVCDWFKQVPEKISSAISGAITKVKTWGTNLVNKAKEAATNFLNTTVNFFKQLPEKLWTWLVETVTKVVTWRANLAEKGREAAKALLDAVVNGIKELPQKILSIGSDLVTGLWNGISNKVGWLKSQISGFASSVLGSIKNFFGVRSPSKKTAWIGEMLDEGLAKGVEDAAGVPIKAMREVSGSVLDAAADVGGVGFERQLSGSRTVTATAAAGAANNSALLSKLDGIYERLGRLQVVLDSGTLVGETIDKIDRALATRQLLTARGV